MLEPKKKKFIIELDSTWVLAHRNDDELPIAAIKAELSKDKTLIIKEASLTSMTVIYTEDTADYSGLKRCVMDVFKSRYPSDNPKEVVSFMSGVADTEDQTEKKPEESQSKVDRREYLEQRRRELIARMSREMEEDDEDEDEDEDGDLFEKDKSALEKINELVGAVEFKALAEEIVETPHDKDMKWELSQSLKASHDLLDKIEDGIVKGKIEKMFSRYYRGNSEINELTRRYIKQESDKVIALANEIIKGDFIVDGLNMPQECRLAIESYLKALQDIAEARKKIFAEINGLQDKHLMSYWTARLCDLIMIIRREHPELIPEEIKIKIGDNIGDLQAKHDELEHCLQVRNQLYDIYNNSYYRFFEESAL